MGWIQPRGAARLTAARTAQVPALYAQDFRALLEL